MIRRPFHETAIKLFKISISVIFYTLINRAEFLPDYYFQPGNRLQRLQIQMNNPRKYYENMLIMFPIHSKYVHIILKYSLLINNMFYNINALINVFLI
jgi:hypothetical protein